jgi:hypothetical protein
MTNRHSVFVASLHTLIVPFYGLALRELALPAPSRLIRAEIFLVRCNRRASKRGCFQVALLPPSGFLRAKT